jgi:ABC-type uncharacterized transport system involved in gliding motility auxiliary subunit
VRINREGETAYFGLAGFNMTDHNAVIEFFAPEREPFLEYDISKLIYSLANPKKRVVGLVTTLPVNGRFMPQGGTQPPWYIMEQMRDFFEVKEIAADAKEIPVDVDVLLIAQPEKVADDLLYAIDQYALKGGRILALVDPVSEAGGPGPMGMLGPFGETSSLDRLLTAWGVSFDQKKFAGDLKHARRVQFGGAGAPVITEYLAWLSLDRSNLDTTDVLAGGIERLNFGTAGILKRTEKATTKFQPLVTTSKQAMAMDAESLKFRPDPVALLRSYKPGTEPLVLAARITGEASTAFPEGPPKPPAERATGSDAKPADAANAAGPAKPAPEVSKPPAAKSGNLNVVVIADSDFLHEQFWAETREAGGQKLVIPTAQNAALLLNAIEHLSGGEVLSGLRGKGVQDRPFDLVDSIRRDSERQFREKEQLLMTKLRNVQQQLSSIETKSDGNVVLSDKDRQAIDSFRREMLDIRRELRDVKHGLRKDIDRVDGIVKFANIAAVPILIALGGAFVAWRRRRPSSRSAGSVA